MANKVTVGIIGCGNISGAYFSGCAAYDWLEVVACADLDPARAKAKADEFKVPKTCSPDELLRDPDVQIVVNLTIPKAHAEINLAALEAGKHAHCEKPFALTRADGARVLEAARTKGLRAGCAPDTFLGAGGQTARGLLAAGAIGRPVAGTAFWAGHGHESWHPDPEFYYKQGGGPMLDMGPYYVTALVNLLGPVKRVAGLTAKSFPERDITSDPKRLRRVTVETSTHLTGVLEFKSGAIVTTIQSFDVWAHSLPVIELHGTEGSMTVPDPNGFGGPVKVRKPGEKEWKEMPLTHSDKVRRGIGVADLARGVLTGRPHRVSGALAQHVLDVMLAFDDSSASGKHVAMTSRCDRPAPLPPGLPLGSLD